MYHVLVNDQTLYYPANTDYTIYETNLKLDVGLAGEFTFKVPSSNPQYANVAQGAVITIMRDDEEYWRGEVKETSIDINKVMSVYCLEDLAWLADEFLAPAKITNDTYEQRFIAAITAYNANRPSDRQFTVGYITNVTSSNLCSWATEYEWSILDSIRQCIALDDGYVRVRRVTTGGVVARYIDVVKIDDYGVAASQPIRFGVNLLDYVEEMNTDNLTNVLTPYGAETGAEIYADYNQRMTGTPIQNNTSIAAYGRHAKAVVFDTDNLTTLNALAAAYLTRYSQPQLSLSISAIDLAEISTDTHFEIGDTIRVVAEPFAIDQNLYLTEQSIDLQDISKNMVTLSGTVQRKNTLTKQTIDTAAILKDMPSESSILTAAKRNALNMLLDETQGGYVVYEYDANNKYIEAINICNAKTIAASTRRWRWSFNGLGFLSRANTNAPWPTSQIPIALTNDGKIVAERIGAGTISGCEMYWGNSNAYNGHLYYDTLASLPVLTVESNASVVVKGDANAYLRSENVTNVSGKFVSVVGSRDTTIGNMNKPTSINGSSLDINGTECASGTITWVDENRRKSYGLAVKNGMVTYINESDY